MYKSRKTIGIIKGISVIMVAIISFVAGIFFITCAGNGGGGAIAEGTVEAINVLFDNAHTGLTADNVQDAIDAFWDEFNAYRTNHENDTDIHNAHKCPPEMVNLGNFCIDKYEASPDTSRVIGTAVDGDSLDRGTGTATTDIYAAQSVVGANPYANITWFDASRACHAVGKRLCTNEEWQLAALGTPDDSENGANDPCNLNNGFIPNGATAATYPGGTGAHKTGTATLCISDPFSDRTDDGVYDMVGNLHEWVSDWVHGNYETTEETKLNPVCLNTAAYGNDYSVHIKDAQYQNYAGLGQCFPSAITRGGLWSGGSQVGPFTMDMGTAPSVTRVWTGSWVPAIGFRCCK